MAIDNPFTTAVSEMPPRFAGRKSEKDLFSRNLKYLKEGNPRNLAFVGDYGTGKNCSAERIL